MLQLLLLLLVLPPADVGAERVSGLRTEDGSCVCAVNSTAWSFPAERYEAVLGQLETCTSTLDLLKRQLTVSIRRLPEMQTLLRNLTARLQPFQYLLNLGLYADLSLRQLASRIGALEGDVSSIHGQQGTTETQSLVEEVGGLRQYVERLRNLDNVNIKAVKERLRRLKNTAESCKTIPRDFRGRDRHCLKGLITNISEPVVTKVSPKGKNFASGSWGKQAELDREAAAPASYWVLPLVSGDQWSNTLRLYQTYEDFMASTGHRDYTIAPTPTHANSAEGPSAVLYGDGLYYHCYRSAEVCRYDLKSGAVKRAALPGSGVGYNNKFPYCYYDCRSSSDIDLEADERGLWVIYATLGNHGNLVVSRLDWDHINQTLNVTHTWETRLFKKAASNAFMVCGVLYATRFVDAGREEVFYAFDTATGQESNTLALPLEKVAKGVAGLSYNPTDKHLYMYNDGYLLAYQAHF